jgi:hypothetical protein
MRVLRAALLCCLTVAALALAACGNSEQNDYVDQVNAVQTEFLNAMTAAASTPPTNPSQAGDLISSMEDAFNTAAEDLQAISPPDDVADLHQQLIDKMSELGDKVSEVGKALKSGNQQQAQQAAQELQDALLQAQTDVTDLTTQINDQLG